MKFQIRQGVFETNSSSMHSLIIATEKQYKDWVFGDLYYSKYDENFITKAEYDALQEDEKFEYISYDEFYEYGDEIIERKYIHDDGTIIYAISGMIAN